MNDRQDSQFETLLREHFASKLDSQLGRSAERFMREAGAAPSVPRMRLVEAPPAHPRLRIFAWSIGLSGAAVAAGIAIVMVLAPMLTQPNGTQHAGSQVVSPIESTSGEDVQPVNAGPQNVEHALSWKTIDQGTVYVDDEVPLRSVLRQADETVRWYDPQRKAHMEMTVPRDQVMLVGYQSQ